MHHNNSQPGDPGQKVVTFYNISWVGSLNVVDDKNAILGGFYAI